MTYSQNLTGFTNTITYTTQTFSFGKYYKVTETEIKTIKGITYSTIDN